MAPYQHIYLYRETVAKVLRSARIPERATRIIRISYIVKFYTNIKSPTKHDNYIKGEEYPLIARLMFAKGEMTKLIRKYDPDFK